MYCTVHNIVKKKRNKFYATARNSPQYYKFNVSSTNYKCL